MAINKNALRRILKYGAETRPDIAIKDKNRSTFIIDESSKKNSQEN